MFVTDTSIGPLELGRALEERGFTSFYVPEHTHIPTSRATPYPGGGELPDEYRRLYDPFVVLTAVASVTTRLRVGTGICLVAQHDPILLAKQVASIDLVSGGRFTFGVGYGWNVEEMSDHGVAPKQRRALVRETLLAMQRLWSDEEASFDGELVHVQPTWQWPKPVQKPWPPIFFGGAAGPTLFRQVVELGAGWMPIGGGGLKSSVPELRRVAEELGRDPATIRLIVTAGIPEPGKLDYFASLGVEEVLVPLPTAPAEVVLPILDRVAPAG